MYFKCFIPLLGTPSAPVFQRLIPASHVIVIAEEQLLTNLSKSWQHQHSAVCRRQQSGLVNKILRQLDGLDLRGIYPAGLLELKSCCRPITFAAAVHAAPQQAQLSVLRMALNGPTAERRGCTLCFGGRRVQGKLCCWWRSDPTTLSCPGASPAPRGIFLPFLGACFCRLSFELPVCSVCPFVAHS